MSVTADSGALLYPGLAADRNGAGAVRTHPWAIALLFMIIYWGPPITFGREAFILLPTLRFHDPIILLFLVLFFFTRTGSPEGFLFGRHVRWVNALIIAFCFWVAIATVIGAAHTRMFVLHDLFTPFGMLRYVAVFAVFYAFRYDASAVRKIFVVVVFLLVAELLLCLLQFYDVGGLRVNIPSFYRDPLRAELEWQPWGYRATGTTANANYGSAHMLLLVPFLVGYIMYSRVLVRRILVGLLLAGVVLMILVGMRSRTGVAAAIVVATGGVALALLRRRHGSKVGLMVFGLILVAALGIYAVEFTDLAVRMRIRRESFFNSLLARIQAWGGVIEDVGLWAFIGRGASLFYRGAGFVDSDYLWAYRAGGIIATSLLLAVMAVVFVKAWRFHKTGQSQWARIMALGALGGIVVIFIYSITAIAFQTFRLGEPFFALLGMVFKYCHTEQQGIEDTAGSLTGGRL